MTGEPPLNTGAVNAIDTWPLLGVVTRFIGASGTVRGLAVTTKDSAPPPATLTARNLMLYNVPFVKPGTTTGEEVEVGLTATHVSVPTLYS